MTAAPAVALLAFVALPPVAPADATVLDDGQGPSRWHALGSDDVTATLASTAAGEAGPTLRYDFHHRAGYAGLERALPLDWPENFELDVALDGEIAGNDIEVKLVDDSGDNVWWYRRLKAGIVGPTTLRIRRRQIDFAWGPSPSHALGHTARLQVVVNAVDGGAGTLQVRGISLVPRAPVPAVQPTPRASAAGVAVPFPDGEVGHAWTCTLAPCALTLDAGAPREFGGLRLDWAPGGRPVEVRIEASDDAEIWQPLATLRAAGPDADWLWLPESEARYVRLRVPAGPAALAAFAFQPPAFGADRNRMIAAAAAGEPRGRFPRGVTAQAWWTLVGTDNGAHSALLSEDGALETDVGGPALEPFVIEDGRVVTWADVASTQALEGGDLPLPAVTWQTPRWTLEASAFADAAGGERLWGRYRLTNTGAAPLVVTLLLALRPYQVNPPAQFLNTPGGVAPLPQLAWDGRVLSAGATRVHPLTRPDRVTLQPYAQHAVPARLTEPALWAPGARAAGLSDPDQLGSAVLAWDVTLAPHASRTIGVEVPWGSAPSGTVARLATARVRVVDGWRRRLGRARIAAPDSAEASALAAAMRTATAHLLISRRDGLLRPGTRAYARAWIRDGAMMSSALLRLGERRAPAEYFAAVLPYLYTNGKVPCCIDARGSDPVPEHDSAGEFLFLADEVLELGGERALVARAWPGIEGAVGWLDQLRAETRVATTPDAARYRGLLPASISHEGYSAKPMHSYWDDFWALRGYTAAIRLALALGHPAEATRWGAARAEFAQDVEKSLAEVRTRQAIDYVPGAADLGDFDATSTTVALAPGTGGADVPEAWLRATFERYWHDFEARRDGRLAWDVYTPYEWRVVGSLVRLGERERALAALRWFFADRKPPAWNQWPEVIGREDRVARFVGDLPHGWVASDFLRSALDLYAYEDDAAGTLVLGAGLPRAWLAGRGVHVAGLVTRYGTLHYDAHASARGLELTLGLSSGWPPGGVWVRLPGARAGVARVDGRDMPFHDGQLRLAAPATRLHLPTG